MTSTTAPSTRNPCQPWWAKKPIPYAGFTARRIAGSWAMPRSPSSAMHVNQITITGPNTAPTVAVPRFWKRKRSDEDDDGRRDDDV